MYTKLKPLGGMHPQIKRNGMSQRCLWVRAETAWGPGFSLFSFAAYTGNPQSNIIKQTPQRISHSIHEGMCWKIVAVGVWGPTTGCATVGNISFAPPPCALVLRMGVSHPLLPVHFCPHPALTLAQPCLAPPDPSMVAGQRAFAPTTAPSSLNAYVCTAIV